MQSKLYNMAPIYVTLERFLGSTTQTAISRNLEMLIPTWDGERFTLPKGFDAKGMGCFYARVLREGEVVLVNRNGGYSTLIPTDKILSMGPKIN